MSKKLIVPVITVTILILSIFVLFVFMSPGSQGMDIESGKRGLLDFVYIKCVTPVSVQNARWQISILVTNRGSNPVSILDVYVNEKQVDLYGLAHGDRLEDGYQVGASVPLEGLRLESSATVNVYVWVGDKLFSSGSEVVIHFNDPNSVSMMKSITLT